jgi:hypothetical protein
MKASVQHYMSHKVHIYLGVSQCLSPRLNWDPPTPSPASECSSQCNSLIIASCKWRCCSLVWPKSLWQKPVLMSYLFFPLSMVRTGFKAWLIIQFSRFRGFFSFTSPTHARLFSAGLQYIVALLVAAHCLLLNKSHPFYLSIPSG